MHHHLTLSKRITFINKDHNQTAHLLYWVTEVVEVKLNLLLVDDQQRKLVFFEGLVDEFVALHGVVPRPPVHWEELPVVWFVYYRYRARLGKEELIIWLRDSFKSLNKIHR